MGCVHTENPIFMYPIVRPAIAPKFQFLFVLFALLTLSIGSVAHAQETITMVLSQNPIAENGGTTTVTATVPKAQVTPFEVRVYILPKDGGELSADTILTFAANATESTGKVTITAVDNDELDGDRQIEVNTVLIYTRPLEPEPTNAELLQPYPPIGTTYNLPPFPVMLTITDDESSVGPGDDDQTGPGDDDQSHVRPTLSSGTVDGAQVVLVFSEALREDAVPRPASFAYSVDGGGPLQPVGVTVNNDEVILTLRDPVDASGHVTVSYTPPETSGSGMDSARALQGLVGNLVDAFDGFALKNVTKPINPLLMTTDSIKAWLSRFGRTVADQVMDAVGARLQGPVGSPPEAGLQANIAGQSLAGAQGGTGVTGAGVMDAADIEPEIHTRSLSGLDLLRSSSFSYSDGDPGAGMMSVWGRGAVTGFDGRDEYDSGTVDVDGTVRSLMLGTDVRRASGVFGAVLTHSHGKGDYRDGPEEEGRIRSTLTGVYPYASHETGGLSLWGIMGYGKGEVTMHHDVSPYRMGTLVTTDMDLQMAAGGLRSELPGSTPDGVSVNAVADVMGVRAESDGVGKMLSAADTKVARMRAGLEGAWDAVEVGGGRMTPVARISFRHDGGDAEGGFGVDIEGRLHWSDPAQGVRMQLRGHGLLGHEADEFRERSISGSVSWDPEPESLRGAAFSLTSSVSESTTVDVDYLLRNPGDHGVAARLSEDDDPGRDNRNSHQRMQAKVGYGIGIFEGRFTGIPELGVGWTDESRIYNLGWRLLKEGSNAGAIEILLEASHREDTDDGESRDRIGLRLKARF